MNGWRHDWLHHLHRRRGVSGGLHNLGNPCPRYRAGAAVMAYASKELDLFRRGYDTLQIAQYLGISEAAAHKALTLQRSAARKLPIPYPSKSTPWPAGQVAYAGR